MRIFEKLIKFCSIFSAFVFIFHFCEKKTDGFSIWSISSNRPFHSEFSIRPLTTSGKQELDLALNQPYRYFGCGGQAYVFFSDDGKYVIKFFKQRLFRHSHLLNVLPLPKFLHRFREKRNWKRDDKFRRDFSSYKIAFEKLQPQTGVIYTHLNKTNHLDDKFLIVDPNGIAHLINLNKFDFIVQKRAEKVHDYISRLIDFGNLEEAQKAVAKIFAMIVIRAKKGFIDRDPLIKTNCGFIGDQIMKIDVGKFAASEKIKTAEGLRNEVIKITNPFGTWLKIHHPELLKTFYEQRREVLSQ